jgi:purine-binding chemotaxis protein CheW
MSTDVAIEAQTRQLVAFTLGEEEYGIPITLVQEIIRFTPPRPIPGSASNVEGVINLRGRIIPVVDLKRRFAISSDAEDTKIVIVEIGETTVGVIVDEVKEVITIDTSMTEPAPSGVASASAEYIDSVAKLEGRLLVILELSQLFGEVSFEGTH